MSWKGGNRFSDKDMRKCGRRKTCARRGVACHGEARGRATGDDAPPRAQRPFATDSAALAQAVPPNDKGVQSCPPTVGCIRSYRSLGPRHGPNLPAGRGPDPRIKRQAGPRRNEAAGRGCGMNAPIPRILIESTWRGRLFGAQWRPAIVGSLDVLEPATGAVITRVGNATAEDVRQAAAEARAAQPGWAATPYDQRAAILRKVAALMEENQGELVYWIMRETGGIEPKAGFEVQMVTSILHRSAAMCTEPQGLMLPSDGGRLSLARRVPRGVIGVISPFNFPLILSSRAVAPALATGNAVVLKPDPRTALTGGFIIARLFEEAGLPKGVLQVLPGGAE